MAAEDKDLNRDPLSGDDVTSHPVGTGIGAAGGAVAGAAAGAVGGPVGMAVGGVVGAIVGGLAGRAAAEAIDPAAEESHWRDNYTKEPYYEQGRGYDDYSPAYRHGMNARLQGEDWDAAEPKLASDWDKARGGSSLNWDQAKPATRAAWDRVDTRVGGVSGTTGEPSLASAGQTGTGYGAGASSGLAADSGRMSQSQNMGSMNQNQGWGRDTGSSSTGVGGAAAAVGSMQSAGDDAGDRKDVIDVLQDLAECSLDGEYGFRACAEQASSAELKSMFLQRADDCARAAQELNDRVRALGGKVEEHGSAAASVHRGWVSVKSALSTYDDKAVLEECERGEDNALARYRKALQKPMPPEFKQLIEKQMQGVQRNHDQVKMMRDRYRNQG